MHFKILPGPKHEIKIWQYYMYRQMFHFVLQLQIIAAACTQLHAYRYESVAHSIRSIEALSKEKFKE